MPLSLSRTCVLDQSWMKDYRLQWGGAISEASIEALLHQQYQFLQEQAKNPAIIQAIQLASVSAAERIAKLPDRPVDQWRKKEKQSVRTLLQFMSRMSTKTSPFGLFTKIGMVQDGKAVMPRQDNWVQMNLHLLNYWQRLLEQHPGFSCGLNIVANPSIVEREGTFEYILNSLNVETLQQMEQQAVMVYILDVLDRETLTFQQLTEILGQEVDAPAPALEAFLRKLIQVGLLNWQWPISARDPNWVAGMKDFLTPYSSSGVGEVSALFEATHAFLQLAQKRGIQSKALFDLHQRHQALAQKIRGELQHHSDSQGEAIRRFQVPSFFFKPEKMVYVDALDEEPVFPSQAILDTRPLLQKLGRFLISQQSTVDLVNLPFWETHFEGKQEVPLLNWYKKWLEAPPEQERVGDHPTFEGAYEYRNLPGMDVHVQLAEPGPTESPYVHALAAYLLDVDVLPAKDQLPYLNHLVEDFGRPMARFLPAFPEKVAEAIRQSNARRSAAKGLLLAENADASYFNVNLHPPLTDWEIVGIDGHARLEKGRQLALKDLLLRRVGPRIGLFHRPTQKEVQVVNLGLETSDARSLLFRILESFSPCPPAYEAWLHELRGKMMRRDFDTLWSYPRIILERRIVLQRRGWYLLPDLVRQLPSGVKTSDLRQLIPFWSRLGLPTSCYIRFDPPEVEGAKQRDQQQDHYKPQFFDFQSPLFVDFFIRQLRSARPQVMQVEEVYPRVKRCREWVVGDE